MEEIKEVREVTAVKVHKTSDAKYKVKKTIYYILGVLEVLLTFRLVFKLLGANPESPFVGFIYTLSGVFTAPFRGIFREATSSGIETTSYLEPPTLIAMIVYALLAYGAVRLIEIYMKPKTQY